MSEADQRAMVGCSIFVTKGVLEFDTIKISLHRTVTACNEHIAPHNVAQRDLDHLVNQLPAPFLFIGDFNAHNDLWGSSSSNSLGNKVGNKVENLFKPSSVCLLYDKSPTCIHPTTGSFTSRDFVLHLFFLVEWPL